MKAELLNATKLKITFEAEDLEEYGLSFEALDYSNARTRQALQAALRAAKEETGFDYAGERLFIEVFPERSGGCSALFTKLPFISEGDLSLLKTRPLGKTYSFSKDYGLFLLALDDADALLDSARDFDPSANAYLSGDLYLFENSYFLLLHLTGTSAAREAVTRRFAEFGRELPKPYLMKSFLEEHGQLLLAGNALEVLRPAGQSASEKSCT